MGLINFDTYKGKKVLITGHTGFKGSWLSYWLKEVGAEGVPNAKSLTHTTFSEARKYPLRRATWIKTVRSD